MVRDQAPKVLPLQKATAAATVLLKVLESKLHVDSYLFHKPPGEPSVKGFVDGALADVRKIQGDLRKHNMLDTMPTFTRMMNGLKDQLVDSNEPSLREIVEIIQNFQDPEKWSKPSLIKAASSTTKVCKMKALDALSVSYKHSLKKLEASFKNLQDLLKDKDKPAGKLTSN